MKANESTPAGPQFKTADVQAAKAAAQVANHKAESAKKLARLAKSRFKVAKKTFKLIRKQARRAAKQARLAKKRLEAVLVLAARQKKQKSLASKSVKKSVQRPGQRRAVAKKLPRQRPVPGVAKISSPAPAEVFVPPPSSGAPLPSSDS